MKLDWRSALGIAAQALVLVPSLRRTGFRWQWRFRARPNEIGRMRQGSRNHCQQRRPC